MLYVEDDENDALFMQRAHKEAGLPFDIIMVKNGEDAIKFLSGTGSREGQQHNPLPCLVLLDLNLTAKTGFEVLSWIRAQEHFKSLPVIIYSSSAQVQDLELAAKLGATDYCVKPAIARDIPEMLRRISARWLSP